MGQRQRPRRASERDHRVTHYETQPNPHPLSWVLHQAPPWLHACGVLFNHFVELIVPFGLFGPRLLRHYGAFGSVGKQRDELIIEGTNSDPEDPNAEWREYTFPCKPGDVARAPCLVTLYHYRLDWQMWFAAMSGPERQPWLVHLVAKLLAGEPAQLGLLANNPFPDGPPSYIRVSAYRYRFTHFGEPGYWKRERLGDWLPALSREDARLRAFLRRRGFAVPTSPRTPSRSSG